MVLKKKNCYQSARSKMGSLKWFMQKRIFCIHIGLSINMFHVSTMMSQCDATVDIDSKRKLYILFLNQEFDDFRDADDAVYELNGKELLGER